MSLLTQLQDRNLHMKIPFMRIGSAADRRDRRYDCAIISTLSLEDRAIIIDGMVDSISQGGIQFRPATTYILDRCGESVSVGIGHRQIHGIIVATRVSGYGLALSKRLEEAELLDIIDEFA